MFNNVKIAIVGGTGIYDISFFSSLSEHVIQTPYGKTKLKVGEINNRPIALLSRHDTKHVIPPHKINFRANVQALKKIGVERILALNATGAIDKKLKPGDFVIVHDFLDFTKNRSSSFFDRHKVVHIDLSQPYCPELRAALISAAERNASRVFKKGVYVCTEGPRYETPAEIKMFKRLGGGVVGMTGVPEVVLAREVEICYGTICTVTNYAAGISGEKLTAEEVVKRMRAKRPMLEKILLDTIRRIPKKRNCPCKSALTKARIA